MASTEVSEADLIVKCKVYFNGNWKRLPHQFCELLGYTREELEDRPISDLAHPDDRTTLTDLIVQLKSGKLQEFETEIKVQSKSGDSIPIYLNGILVRDAEGKPEYITFFIHSSTGKKRKKQTSQHFNSLFKHNPQPVYYFDPEGNFKDVNQKLVEFTGYSREELLGTNFRAFIVEEDLDRTIQHFEKALAGESGQYEIQVIVKGGEKKDIRVTKFPMYVGDKVQGVFGILQDITEQKKQEQKLQESEQRFKSLFERNPNAVYSFDLEGNFVMANKALTELTGYSKDELGELGFEPIVAPEDREFVWDKFEKAARGKSQTYEASGIHKDGRRIEVQVTNLPIYVNGKIEGVFGIAQDITNEKQAKRRLKESEERWQRLVEENPQPVQIVQDGKIAFINEVGAEFYGAPTAEQLIGKPIMEFAHPENMDEMIQRKERLEREEYIEPDEHKIVRLDGEERYIETHSIPIKYKGENAIQTVIHDITERKEQEENIKTSLNKKEILLQEIHHRVKNNLAVISGLLELQAMNTDDEATITTLRQSQLRIQSMAMIHQKLYQSEALSDIGFDHYLKELVETIERTYDLDEKEIQVTFNLEPVKLDIEKAIPAALIINELLANCFEHAFTDQNSGSVAVHLQKNQNRVELKIIDDGKGIEEDFNMQEQQTLGMTLVNTLTSQLKGELNVQSNGKDTGTNISIKFDIY